MDDNKGDKRAPTRPNSVLGGLLDLKDWLTLDDAANCLAQRLGKDVSDADLLRLALDERMTLSVRFVNGIEARRGRCVAQAQATYTEVPSLDLQSTVRLYRGPRLDNGDVIELEEGTVQLRGVFDLPMIGGEQHTVEDEYQCRAGDETATGAPRVVVTDVAIDGAFVTDGEHYFQLQDWLEGDGFRICSEKEYRLPVRKPYPRARLPDDAVLVVRPESLRELLARLNAGDKPPRFVIPLRPREVPQDLMALPRDARVHFINPPLCGRTGEGIMKAGDVADMIRDTIARQAEGWLTIEEAAQELGDAGRGSATGRGGWVEKLTAAARAGDLPMHEPDTLARIDYGLRLIEQDASLAKVGGRRMIVPGGISYMDERRVRPFYEWAHLDDLNRWLAANEPRLPFRFGGPAQPTSNSGQAEMTKAMTAVPTKPVQRQAAQEAAILAKLAELGFDAGAVPAAPAGKPSQAKQAVRAALGYSTDVMNKAWQRLRTTGVIKDA